MIPEATLEDFDPRNHGREVPLGNPYMVPDDFLSALIAELRASRKVVRWAAALAVSESDGEAWELSWQEMGRALAELSSINAKGDGE